MIDHVIERLSFMGKSHSASQYQTQLEKNLKKEETFFKEL